MSCYPSGSGGSRSRAGTAIRSAAESSRCGERARGAGRAASRARGDPRARRAVCGQLRRPRLADVRRALDRGRRLPRQRSRVRGTGGAARVPHDLPTGRLRRQASVRAAPARPGRRRRARDGQDRRGVDRPELRELDRRAVPGRVQEGGRPLAVRAPRGDHGAISAGLAALLGRRFRAERRDETLGLTGWDGCRSRHEKLYDRERMRPGDDRADRCSRMTVAGDVRAEPGTEALPVLISARGVAKTFGATQALRGASFELRAGEVHALVGENGSGKSTLVKVLSGVHAPDAGEIELGGSLLPALRNPRAAVEAGIVTVFQEVLVAEARSVLDNVWLGADGLLRTRIPVREKRARAREALGELLGRPLGLDTPVEELSLSDRQACSIVRALLRRPRVLILDEATSALDVATRDRLFGIIGRLGRDGVGIVFITH